MGGFWYLAFAILTALQSDAMFPGKMDRLTLAVFYFVEMIFDLSVKRIFILAVHTTLHIFLNNIFLAKGYNTNCNLNQSTNSYQKYAINGRVSISAQLIHENLEILRVKSI